MLCGDILMAVSRTRTFPPPQQQQSGSSTAADGGVGGGGGSGSGSSACNTSDSGDDSGGSSPTPHDNSSSSSSSSSSHSTPHSSSSSSTPCFTCLSGACSITNDVGVEKEYVLVGCNNSSCNEGDRMHYECFVQFEDAVLKFMRKTGRARSWSEEQRCSNLWTDKGYGLVKKVCKCRCGRGFLRPDLAHHQSAAAAASAAASAATQATQSQRKGSGRRSRGKGKGRASVTSGGSPPPQLSGSAATRAAFAVGLPADAIADIAAPFSASSSSSSSSSGGGGGAVTASFPQAVGTGSPVGSWSPQQPSAAFLSQHQHQHQHPHHTHAQQQQQHRTTHPFQQQNDGHHRQDHRRESAPGTSPLWGDGGGGGSAAAVFADAVVAVAAPQARAVLPFNDLAPSLAAPDWATSPTKAGSIGIGIGIAIGSSVDGGDAEGDVVMHDLQDTSWLEEDRAPPQRRWSMPGFFSDGVGGPADEAATATYRMHSADLSWAGHPHQHGQQQHQHGQQQQQQQHQGPHLPWGNDGSSGAARQDTDGMQGGGGSWTSATGSVSANNSPARHWVQPIVPTTTTATAATAAAAAAAIDHTTSPMQQRWSSGWADAGDGPRLVV